MSTHIIETLALRAQMNDCHSKKKKKTDTSEEKIALASHCSCQTTWHLISTELCFT